MMKIPNQELSLKLKMELSLALAEIGLEVSVEAQEKLVDYLLLLQEWNSVYNLTGIKDPFQMLRRHIIDSLVLMPILSGPKVLDVGTGAGIPGILLAVVRPDLQFVLLDSNQKKMNFVQHVILSLKLRNVEAVCQRVEKYKPDFLFDGVISRAFASLKDFVLASMPLLKPKGMFLAMKGQLEQAELEVQDLLQELPTAVKVVEIRSLMVPLLRAERCIVLMQKISP